jgi:HAE1 family hydrophobic/amphiphilic exporter-1
VIRLVRFFVQRYVFALSIFLAIILFGLSSILRLGIDLLPEFDIPVVAVNTTYSGAGSAETAEQITEPIEDTIATLPGVSDISSFSGEGFSFVIVQFNSGIDVDQASIDVKQRIDAIQDTLPDDASNPTIQKFDPADQPILNLALSAPGVRLADIQRIAEDVVEPPLQQIEGVADVAVIGPVERELQVLVDPGKLQSLGLSIAQVAGAISASSLTLPAGSLTFDDERILLSVRSIPATAAEVERMIVDPAQGIQVRDVATVRDTVSEPAAFTRLDGEAVVILEVRKVSGANSVGTARNLRGALDRLALPDGYELTIVGDTTVFIENSVFDTLRETSLAVLAVAFVVLLFVGRLGSTFSVVLAIPITMTGAVIIFGLLDFSFNVVTLLAITVAVGLVVDDSIVIAESIERYRAKGYGLKDAVYKGAGEVSVAVLTATLSLLAVFLPIAFLPGIIGQFFSQFGLSLAAAIFVSYLEAMFFLTVRMAYLPNPLPPSAREIPGTFTRLGADLRVAVRALRKRRFWALVILVALAAAGGAARIDTLPEGPTGALIAGSAGLIGGALALFVATGLLRYLGRIVYTLIGSVLRQLHEWTDAGVTQLRRSYASTLSFLLDRSSVVLVVAALLIASLGWVFPRIDFNFTSEVDAGLVNVSVSMPPGTPLARTDQVSTLIENELRTLPEAVNVLANVGSDSLLGTGDAQQATVTVELISQSGRERSSFEIADAVRPRLRELLAQFPEARLEVGSDDGGAVPVETGVELTLFGNDRDLLAERDQIARRIMRDNPFLRNVSSSLEGSVSERVFEIQPSSLAGTGLTPSEIATTLRAYNVGIRAANLRDGGQEVPIQVRLDPAFIRDEQTLLSLPIFAPALQSFIPLSALGTFVVQAAPVSIDRANQAYIATVRGDLTADAPGQFQVRADLEEAFAAGGVTDELVSAGAGVGPDLLGDLVFFGPIAFGLALLLNYLVIASQFNSFRYPLYLLLTVPLALVGAFWLFYFTGSALDVISVLGVVILIGLVTKNAILLLDVVVSQYREGESLKETLIRAGRLRLRPILMTALTVVIISVPLLLGLGEGSEFRRPLGLVILGGVVSSTFLTLFVVPSAFYRFERHRFAKAATERSGRGDERPSAPEPDFGAAGAGSTD